MTRSGFPILLCAGLVCAGVVKLSARAGDSPEQRQKNLLAVQVALERGLECIQKGEFASAVAVLEKQIPYIDGNRRYLNALRDAYAGHIKQLEQAGNAAEAKKYRGFLEILDPAAARVEATPTRTTPVHRGKVEEDDPFADSNRASIRKSSLLERAEQAFAEKGYETAARLYAQAEQQEPGCCVSCRERWAYCRLYVVAQELGRPTGARTPKELEQEVKQALRMAPRLEPFGQGLLDRLGTAEKSKEPTLQVKHQPRKANGWAVTETANFRIFHTVSEEQAEKIARIAEATRVNMTLKWFAEPARDWSPRCDLYVHPTAQGYAKATGAPAASPGHSSISLEGGRVAVRRVDLRGDDPNFLLGVLPHETTHVVLAGRFGTHHVPRWADEGMAVLSEPRQRVAMHLKNLPMHRRDGTLFALAELVRMADYPEPRRIGPFYAQSVSLVDFLCKKKDPATFARFVREGLDNGYESALQRHYGYRSFSDLEREWQEYAFGEASVATLAEQPR